MRVLQIAGGHTRKSVLSFTQIQSDVAKTHLVLLGYGVSRERAGRNNTSEGEQPRASVYTMHRSRAHIIYYVLILNEIYIS